MSRAVGWKVFVLVILSAVGAVAPLKEGTFAVWSMCDFRGRLLLYLTLAGLGAAAVGWRRNKLAFASGLASAVLCAWSFWDVVWLPAKPIDGLTEIVPTRVGWGWLVWLASVLFLCGIAIREVSPKEAREMKSVENAGPSRRASVHGIPGAEGFQSGAGRVLSTVEMQKTPSRERVARSLQRTLRLTRAEE